MNITPKQKKIICAAAATVTASALTGILVAAFGPMGLVCGAEIASKAACSCILKPVLCASISKPALCTYGFIAFLGIAAAAQAYLLYLLITKIKDLIIKVLDVLHRDSPKWYFNSTTYFKSECMKPQIKLKNDPFACENPCPGYENPLDNGRTFCSRHSL